ncbi:MAG: O-antigen ligase family protein, partial [Planctomycetota bacterium]
IFWALGIGAGLQILSREWSAFRSRIITGAAGAVFLLVLCAAVFVVAGIELKGFDSASSKAAAFRKNAASHLSVRLNYWAAGAGMFKEYPLFGTGLDQFGSFYTQFKTISGWAVKRAHNTYLQILTDGGLLLFIPFILFWTAFFAGRSRGALSEEDSVAGIASKDEAGRIIYPVFFAMPSALLLTCFIFSGLHVEFFFNEINGGPFSSWPADKIPGLIHLLVHICLMPFSGAAVFYYIWKFLNTLQKNEAWFFLKAGLAIIFIHFFFDFHYHMQVISMSIWILAALVTASFGRVKEYTFKVKRRSADIMIILSIFIFGAIGYRLVFPHWARVNLINTAYTLSRAGEYPKALKIYGMALSQEKEDSELQRRISSIYAADVLNKARALLPAGVSPENSSRYMERAVRKIKPEIREQVIKHARLAVKYNPAPAANYAYLGRELFKMFPLDKDRLREAEQAFLKAVEKHPYKPSYLVWLGRVYTSLGEKDKAVTYFRKADKLSKNPLLTDDRAKLNEFEKMLVTRVREEAEKSAP